MHRPFLLMVLTSTSVVPRPRHRQAHEIMRLRKACCPGHSSQPWKTWERNIIMNKWWMWISKSGLPICQCHTWGIVSGVVTLEMMLTAWRTCPRKEDRGEESSRVEASIKVFLVSTCNCNEATQMQHGAEIYHCECTMIWFQSLTTSYFCGVMIDH